MSENIIIQPGPTETVTINEISSAPVGPIIVGPGQGGSRGPTGPTGPTGPIGPDKPLAYLHNQAHPSAVWDITHNLDFCPNVTVMDSAGSICEGEVEHLSANRLTVSFSGAFSGKAYLS